ncbi:hypothetical protein BKA56DRAFT_595952 [Ilyonectria sp. MPI-CAGE-AT-0026]|nr:hypothetical protein BKA56DRAFT_595952 [Ilyonectria sp. MPI-CAGE-AT-0026]
MPAAPRRPADSSRRIWETIKTEDFTIDERDDRSLRTENGSIEKPPGVEIDAFAVIKARDEYLEVFHGKRATGLNLTPVGDPDETEVSDSDMTDDEVAMIPKIVPVHYLNPDIILSLSRSAQIMLLKRLSRKQAKIIVHDNERKLVTRRDGDEFDLAVVLILSIALRGNHAFAGLLVGLSQPATIKAMRPFYRRPFLDASVIVELTHGAARVLSQRRKMDRPGYGEMAIVEPITKAVASLLKSSGEILGNSPASWFIHAFKVIICSWRADRDRGLQIGLLLVGEARLLRAAIQQWNEKADLGTTILRSIHGAVGGAPIAGFVSAAIEPWTERAVNALTDRQLQKYNDAWGELWTEFQNTFRKPASLHNCVVINGVEFQVGEYFLSSVDLMLDDEKLLPDFMHRR